MPSTPSSRPNSNAGPLKLTPNSHCPARSTRSPKLRNLYESGLSLQRIIGTTVSSPTAFATLPSSRIFAYTAGAAAVVVNADENSIYSQRFFRARPTAVSLNSTPFSPTTSVISGNDGRNKSGGGVNRDPTFMYSPTTSYSASDWGESPSSKTWTSRERIKAATCLSISSDGKLLAVGEDYSSDSPLVIISEHTYGVRAVAFSPDSRYLASLGTTNDGFIYIWAINQRVGAAKLHLSNKCTSFVKQMVWLGDTRVVTVGTRHIKIWKVSDNQGTNSPTKQSRYTLDGTSFSNLSQPTQKILLGRNVLLGPLVDVTFTALAAISDHRAIVCSEKGDLCLVDDSESSKLLKLTNTGFSITCIAVDIETRRVKVGGKNGKMISINLDDLLSPNTPPTSPTPAEEPSECTAGHICAMGFAGRKLVTVDTNHLIQISRLDSHVTDPDMQSAPFSAHNDSVLGVCLISPGNPLNADFLTWSANGVIMFWNLNGTNKGSIKVSLQQPNTEDEPINQCLNVRVSKGAEFLVYGDRYGVLRIVKILSQDLIFETKAHTSDIYGISLYETADLTLLATCGRDRTVQLYRLVAEEWFLVQTLDDHTASVTDLFITADGEKLISSSTDRTLHVRRIANRTIGGVQNIFVLPQRIITLKSTPVSIAPYFADQINNIIVSLSDRTVATYDITTGRIVMSFKASDNDSIEAVALDSLVVGMPYLNSGRSSILAGVSSMDKSVRVYDGSTGTFLDREWGHTTSVTDVALVERSDSDLKTVISTGSDGTIMIWSLSPKEMKPVDSIPLNSYSNDNSPLVETNSRVPLRRILSKAELAEIQKSSPNTSSNGPKSPRLIRRKTSRLGLVPHASSQPPVTSSNNKINNPGSDYCLGNQSRTRVRSRSQPPIPKNRDTRKSSLVSYMDTRGTKKGSPVINEFGSLNIATEQACRTLRTYRKKLLTCESIKDSALKELDHELRLTAVALGDKSQKSQAISETVLTGLLDQYSERLVSIFDEKLRSSRLATYKDNLEEQEKKKKN